MKKKTLISIINWNNNLATNACLKSIALIPKNKQPDIYLADNHSEKEKLKIDNKLVDKLKSFTFIQNNSNLGYAGGHNQAIKYAQEQDYDYICLLNNVVFNYLSYF